MSMQPGDCGWRGKGRDKWDLNRELRYDCSEWSHWRKDEKQPCSCLAKKQQCPGRPDISALDQVHRYLAVGLWESHFPSLDQISLSEPCDCCGFINLGSTYPSSRDLSDCVTLSRAVLKLSYETGNSSAFFHFLAFSSTRWGLCLSPSGAEYLHTCCLLPPATHISGKKKKNLILFLLRCHWLTEFAMLLFKQ